MFHCSNLMSLVSPPPLLTAAPSQPFIAILLPLIPLDCILLSSCPDLLCSVLHKTGSNLSAISFLLKSIEIPTRERELLFVIKDQWLQRDKIILSFKRKC